MKRLNQRGYNLVELMIAVGILAAITSSVIIARSFMAKQTVRSSDKAYATQKAIQMFEELKTLVSAEQSGINVLDQYSDGSRYNTVLTTDKAVDTASPTTADAVNSLSGNMLSNGHARYLRQIQIFSVPNNAYARQVIIKVWRYASDAAPSQPGELLSEIGGMLTTASTLETPTQVFDIYVLTVNNIQGWWSQIPTLGSTFRDIVGDIKARNPGLEVRPHYITRSSYGRDAQYAPYINVSKPTTQAGSLPWVYFYPGMSPQNQPPNGTGTNDYFYDPNGVEEDGKINVDDTITTTDALFNGCPSYPTADMYNNSMRYPDELAMWRAVTLAGHNASPALGASSSVTEISERLLIEGMLSSPQSFQNAMIVNLHGELLPLPPMRNYSDAAKDPANYPNVRLVAHPENLYYPFNGAGTTNINLRVYAYYDGMLNPDITQLDNAYPATTAAQMPKIPVSTILLPGLFVSASSVTAVAITGDAENNYAYQGVTVGGVYASGMSMVVNSVSSPASLTTIYLYNTPLRCPSAPNGSGLYHSSPVVTDRLYGMEYIPSSPERTSYGAPFTNQDLTSTAAPGTPKNTARWVINIPIQNGCQEIDVAIGNSSPTTLPNAVAGPNQERTYVWAGGDVDAPPWTERYQFLGDPRHCPYLDVKVQGPAAAGVNTRIEANGYNWYFKNLDGGTGTVDGYSGFNQAGNIAGWTGDNCYIDVPRFYEMIRKGLLNTTAIWTTMNGWSYYYFGFGGEMGSDQPPYNQGLSMINSPWSTTQDNTIKHVAEMIDYQGNVINMRVVSDVNSYWHAKTWLGELYPDQFEPQWSAYGNLPTTDHTGSFIVRFYRKLFSAVNTYGTSKWGFGRDLTSRTSARGCGSFYNGIGPGGGKFDHTGNYSVSSSLIQPMGNNIYSLLQYPLSPIVNLTRAWQLDESTGTSTPAEWNKAPYNTTRTSLSVPAPSVSGVSRYFYDQGTAPNPWKGNGVVKMQQVTGGVTQTAYVIESGLAISANVGTAELGKTALVSLLRTFWDGGLYTGSDHITQLPLVKVTVNSLVNQFTNPTSISVTVTSPVLIANAPITNVWFRFPGITSSTANYYTEEYTDFGYPVLTNNSYSESTNLDVNLKYCPDGNQLKWYFLQDNAVAEEGVLDQSVAHLISVSSAPIIYNWDVSNTTTFPQGSYWIRAEVYRQGFPLNYSFHRLQVAINR